MSELTGVSYCNAMYIANDNKETNTVAHVNASASSSLKYSEFVFISVIFFSILFNQLHFDKSMLVLSTYLFQQ